MSHAKCPYCGEELEPTTVFSNTVEHCGDDLVIQVGGWCEKCEKTFEWEEVFDFHLARHLEET